MKCELSTDQASEKNREFWDEPCGTCSFLKGKFKTKEDFDSWYFKFYPYLKDHIPFNSLSGKKVLEIGLGMGSISEKIAYHDALYHGMDIADGSVELVTERLKDKKLSGDVIQGDILSSPWEDNFFDWIISIGCLHHTGNFKAALSQVVRSLKPGGESLVMVYNAFSYRQWMFSPFSTFRKCFPSVLKYQPSNSVESQRFLYDHNTDGSAAPFTEFLSRKQIEDLLADFDITPSIRSENIGSRFMFPLPRNLKLRIFGSWLGLDLYIYFKKPRN